MGLGITKEALENVVILDWNGSLENSSLPILNPPLELIAELLDLSESQKYILERALERVSDFKDLPGYILNSLQSIFWKIS